MNKTIVLSAIGVLSLLALFQIPIQQSRILSYGEDRYNAHQPLFGDKTLQQYISSSHTITGIGTILVDLRRSNQLTPVMVEITDSTTGQLLVSAEIPPSTIHDDQFTYTQFSKTPIAKNRDIRILFTAQEATSANPIGLRFDPKNNTLSLALIERVPVWKAIVTMVQNQSNTWGFVLLACIASLIVALPAFLPHKKIWWLTALGLIVLGAYSIRSATEPYFGGVSGGDAYNYLSISQTLSTWKNPFENTKRLPGYPLILTPFYVSGIFDDHDVMRYIQIIASSTGILFLAGIARALKLSWATAIVASAILAFQKDYFFTSLRPEPYSLYTALLLSSLFLFFSSYMHKKIWIYIVFGLCLGYGAMVRQEGFVLAAVLGASSLAYEVYTGKSIKRLLLMYVPALCIVLPFFIHNTFTYGHPLYTEYFEGDRLQIVDSYLAFQDSVGASWGVISSMWKPSWDSLERVSLDKPVFISSVVLLWAWYALLKIYKNTSTTTYVAIFASVAWVSLVLASVYMHAAVAGIIPIVTAAWILASIPLLLIETRWRGLVILLVLVSQILIATWFHPFPKHYQQSYPLIILMIATALVSQIPVQKKILTASTLALSTLPFFVIAMYLSKGMNAELDRYNANTALDSVTYRAARYARTLPGPIGFDQAYLPARLYFDPDARYFPDEDHPTPEMEQEWLEKTPVKTMVVTNGNNVFKKIPSNWQKIKDFKAAGNDEEILVATIYAIPF